MRNMWSSVVLLECDVVGLILFTDESRLHVNSNDRSRVYRRVGERYADACVIKVDRLVESVVLGVITERGDVTGGRPER
jgi:hypothetical protein